MRREADETYFRKNVLSAREELFGLRACEPLPLDAFERICDLLSKTHPGWAIEALPYMESDRARAKLARGNWLGACAPGCNRVFLPEHVHDAAMDGEQWALAVGWHEVGHMFSGHSETDPIAQRTGGVFYEYEEDSRRLYRPDEQSICEAEATIFASEMMAPSTGVTLQADLEVAAALYDAPLEIVSRQFSVGATMLRRRGW